VSWSVARDPVGGARVGTWSGTGRGTVVLVPGRGDSLELREDVAARLADRGLTTVLVEHVGQGGSGRLGRHPDAVHVDDFRVHLDAADRATGRAAQDGPVFVLAHSMGGLVAAHLLARRPHRVAAAVLTAPMWGFGGPVPRPVVRALATGLTCLGRGRDFAAGERPWDLPGCLDMRTADPERRAALARFAGRHRDLVRGGSTWGWTAAAARAMAQLDRLPLHAVATPVTAVAARADRTVSGPAIARTARRFPRGRLLVVDGGHDVLNGGPEARRLLWAEIDERFAPSG
jgi:lysophospholipase